MNSIAVVFRGHLRTWNFCKHVLLSQFSKLATNVDFYFSIWNTKTINTIETDCKDYNLKEIILFPISSNYYLKHQSISWLSHNIAESREFQNNRSTYDAVIDTRPDILPCFVDINKIFYPESNTVHTEFADNNRISDLLFLFDTRVFEIFSRRHIDINDYLHKHNLDIHVSLHHWCHENKLIPDKKVSEFWYNQIIRPDILDYYSSANHLMNLNSPRNHLALCKNWNFLPDIKKQEDMKKHGIDPTDYDVTDHYQQRLDDWNNLKMFGKI